MSKLNLVGVEDGSFRAFQRGCNQTTLLCAVNMIDESIQKIHLRKITVDGLDATDKLLEIMKEVECNAILLGGVSFAGFNIIDAHKINKMTGQPVIIFTTERPDSALVLAALKTHFSDWKIRWAAIEKIGDVYETCPRIDAPPVFYEIVGAKKEWAEEILKKSAVFSRTPEPIRVAGIIARGLTRIV